MEESVDGRKEQNEAARVEVRRGYKHLMEDISRNEETLICPEDDNNELLGYLRQGDQLFSQVRGPQECVMDAAVVRNLSRICRSQVHQMSTNINQFACEEYAEKLRRSININNTGLDRRRWIQLGQQAKSMFRRSPHLTFMYGALSEQNSSQKISRERRSRQTTKLSDLKETRAQTLQEAETSDNITDRIVQKILRRLVEKFKENGKKPINYYEFVLHPTDFGASVENMFHVSFLVKENRAGVSFCPDSGLPLIQPISNKQNSAQLDSCEGLAKSQVVMNWTVESWEKIVKDLNIKTATIIL